LREPGPRSPTFFEEFYSVDGTTEPHSRGQERPADFEFRRRVEDGGNRLPARLRNGDTQLVRGFWHFLAVFRDPKRTPQCHKLLERVQFGSHPVLERFRQTMSSNLAPSPGTRYDRNAEAAWPNTNMMPSCVLPRLRYKLQSTNSS